MKTITAICFGWSVFVIGCSAASGVEDGPPNSAERAPATGDEPNTALDVPILEQQAPSDIPPRIPALALEPAPEGSDIPVEETPKDEPIVELPPPPPGPRQFEGNPTCAEAFPESSPEALTLELPGELRDGTFKSADGDVSVTIDFSGSSLGYTSLGPVIGIIVKGGPHAIAYPSVDGSGTELATPNGEQISHVTICYLP